MSEFRRRMLGIENKKYELVFHLDTIIYGNTYRWDNYEDANITPSNVDEIIISYNYEIRNSDSYSSSRLDYFFSNELEGYMESDAAYIFEISGSSWESGNVIANNSTVRGPYTSGSGSSEVNYIDFNNPDDTYLTLTGNVNIKCVVNGDSLDITLKVTQGNSTKEINYSTPFLKFRRYLRGETKGLAKVRDFSIFVLYK